jgi:hypothetical protein
MVTDDLDHPVEIEIGDDIAAEQFEPGIDLVEPVLRTAEQHFDLVDNPLFQHFGDAHNLGHPVLVEHIHVEREAIFKIGHAEQRIHQIFGIDCTTFRLQDNPHLLVRFIADIGENRQFLVGNDLGDLLDQLALLHLIGNFGDDNLPCTAPLGVFLLPFAAYPHRTTATLIGGVDNRLRIDQCAASRKIRPLDDRHDLGMFRLGRINQ